MLARALVGAMGGACGGARAPSRSCVELALVPASEIVSLGWTVDALWSAIEDDTPQEPPVPRARTVLVWRRDLRVLHRTLDPDEAALVSLVAPGASLAAVSARLGEVDTGAPEQRMVELLARWIDAEVLRR